MNWPFNYGDEMTLRDKLAASCLSAIYQHHTMWTCRAAELAYEQADEMLKARSTPPQNETHK